jgi:hypothetical protein
MALAGLSSVCVKSIYTQACIDQAVIACALERYHMANGAYPDELQKLVPKYLEKIPKDLITGGPLHYRLNTNETFQLYSVGADGRDRGGAIGADSGRDLWKTDWVW